MGYSGIWHAICQSWPHVRMVSGGKQRSYNRGDGLGPEAGEPVGGRIAPWGGFFHLDRWQATPEGSLPVAWGWCLRLECRIRKTYEVPEGFLIVPAPIGSTYLECFWGPVSMTTPVSPPASL